MRREGEEDFEREAGCAVAVYTQCREGKNQTVLFPSAFPAPRACCFFLVSSESKANHLKHIARISLVGSPLSPSCYSLSFAFILLIISMFANRTWTGHMGECRMGCVMHSVDISSKRATRQTATRRSPLVEAAGFLCSLLYLM